jgi:putative hydrolase of the HAD superfamily
MIRNIIFDLGNVLVKVDYANFRRRLKADAVTDEAYSSFFGADDHFKKYFEMGYESGVISTNEFLAKCIEGLKLTMSPRQYADAFNDMFITIEPMAELVKKLASEKKYRLFLLSNTSPLHFEFITENYDYINLLHDFALSYRLKSLKPQKEIYDKALALFGAAPDECIFIDDLKQNCEGASAAGIKTIQYDLNNHKEFEERFYPLINNI